MNDAEILFKAWELRYKRENTFVQKLVSILYKINVHYTSRSAFQIACTGQHFRLHEQVSISDCMSRSAFQIASAWMVSIPDCVNRLVFRIAWGGFHAFLLPFTNYNMQRYYQACGTRQCAFNCKVKDLEFEPHQGVSHCGPRQAVNLSLCKENISWPIHHRLYVFLKYG